MVAYTEGVTKSVGDFCRDRMSKFTKFRVKALSVFLGIGETSGKYGDALPYPKLVQQLHAGGKSCLVYGPTRYTGV